MNYKRAISAPSAHAVSNPQVSENRADMQVRFQTAQEYQVRCVYDIAPLRCLILTRFLTLTDPHFSQLNIMNESLHFFIAA